MAAAPIICPKLYGFPNTPEIMLVSPQPVAPGLLSTRIFLSSNWLEIPEFKTEIDSKKQLQLLIFFGDTNCLKLLKALQSLKSFQINTS